FNLPWDPFESKATDQPWASLRTQLKELLEILRANDTEDGLPLTGMQRCKRSTGKRSAARGSSSPPSIMRALFWRCAERDHPLSLPLRYVKQAPKGTSEKETKKLRTRVVRRMLNMLSAAGFVSHTTGTVEEGTSEE